MSVLTTFLRTPASAETPYCVLESAHLNEDKENRKNFHAFIREQFGLFLVTDTLELENSRSIRVWLKKLHEVEQVKFKKESAAAASAGGKGKGGKGKRFKPAGRDNSGISVGVMMKDPWPQDRPNYLHFHLYKENRDTAEAIQSIARCLRIPPKSFQFCGTKDRRGITVQSVSVYRISVEGMKRAMLHSAWDKAVRVSNFEYKSSPNKIGRSNGNHFKICLKRVDPAVDNPEINALFTSLRDSGFLNYYGNQRFGTRSVRTHHVGALLMAQNWKGVVDILLSPQADERMTSLAPTGEDQFDRNQWRLEYVKGHIEKAHELCPSFLYIEKALLRSLHQSGQSTNYLNAIQSLPTSTCHLYLHSVQSLAFNAALGERVRTHGYKVVVGDLVAIPSNKRPRDTDHHDEPEQPVESGEGDEEETADDGKVDTVKVIETEEEASQYSIHDVVLTLVGSSVQTPPNMEKFYANFFTDKLECSIESFTDKEAVPSFIQLRGAYRKIVQKANNLKWEIHEVVRDRDVVIKSDVDLLKEKLASTQPADVVAEEQEENGEVVAVEPKQRPSKAVVFECDLNSGVYLTMAIREITLVVDGVLSG